MSKGSYEDGVVFHAGFPNAAEDGTFGSLSLDSFVVQHRASTFFWQLAVDMPEMLWSKGSVLVVDRSLQPQNNAIVVVIYEDEFLLCRYNKGVYVRFSGEKVTDGEIWGVVTFCLQNFQGRSL